MIGEQMGFWTPTVRRSWWIPKVSIGCDSWFVALTPRPRGTRLIGFDNAHAARGSRGPGGTPKGPYDHRHQMDTVRAYRFKDPATLIEDFWAEVDRFLKEKGVL